MEFLTCNLCGGEEFHLLYEKPSRYGEIFFIQRCKSCGLVQVNPQPSFEETLKYYSEEYFTQRSERGYDNYYSAELRGEIERVFQLNLSDLNFFEWEKSLGLVRTTLDIGCAAGYFVNYMQARGWQATGIEIAEGPARYAKERLGLNIIQADFLNWDTTAKEKFHLITLWASLEHLHKPKQTLEKIYFHLFSGGHLILSTCRYGLLAKFMGLNWRYLNVPEHLYYYSLPLLCKQLENLGFQYVKHITYGSGMTMKKQAGKIFKFTKQILDRAVKFFDQGDMMAVHFLKP